jgi:hypothetical protein
MTPTHRFVNWSVSNRQDDAQLSAVCQQTQHCITPQYLCRQDRIEERCVCVCVRVCVCVCVCACEQFIASSAFQHTAGTRHLLARTQLTPHPQSISSCTRQTGCCRSFLLRDVRLARKGRWTARCKWAWSDCNMAHERHSPHPLSKSINFGLLNETIFGLQSLKRQDNELEAIRKEVTILLYYPSIYLRESGKPYRRPS